MTACKRSVRALALLMTAVLMVVLCGACADNTTTTGNFGFQLELPAIGEEIAIMHTNHGDLYIRFFPEQAPKAVQNFKTLSQNGYYDGVLFYRVVEDFMIQSGDPTASGSGGQSCWGGTFEDEFSADLGNLRGALAMANRGENTNGSQFFINQAPPTDSSSVAVARAMYEANAAAYTEFAGFADYYRAYCQENFNIDPEKLTDQMIAVYEQTGGNIHLDGAIKSSGGHTVFGQVFRGMDVVDAIALLETNENKLPLTLAMIDTIEWTTYQGE